MDLEDADGVGRRLYWPEAGPAIARSLPEGDLLIVFASADSPWIGRDAGRT